MQSLNIDILDRIKSLFTKPPMNTFSDGNIHCFTP